MNKIEQMLQELCPEGVEYRRIGDVFVRLKGTPITAAKMKEINNPNGEIKIFAGGKTVINANEDDIENANIMYVPSVIVQSRGVIDVIYCDQPFTFKNEMWAYTINSPITVKYLYYVLKNNIQIFRDKASIMGSLPQISLQTTEKFEIPIPPFPIQEEIVRILDHFTELAAELQAELQARQEQYEYYNNRLLSFDDDIPKMKLNDVVTFMNGKGHEKYIEDQGAYIVVNSKFISTAGKVIKYSNSQISPLYKDMILMVMSDLPNGKALAKCFVVDADNKYTLNQRIGAFTIRDKNLITTRFLYYILDRNKQLLSYDNGADQTNLRKGDILNIIIPVPPLSEQQRIVSILDKFETLVNDLSQGLPAEITAVQEQYEYYRNKLLTFNRIESN